MGFRRAPLLVDFPEGDELNGLQVRLRRLSVRALLEVSDLAGDAGTEREEQSTRALIERLAEAIVAWNLEDDDGQLVPTDVDSLLDQDFVMLLAIVHRWMDVADVPAPLARPSTGGSPSPVVSIPMDVLSPNPPSLPALS
jgi:hypothetical protein